MSTLGCQNKEDVYGDEYTNINDLYIFLTPDDSNTYYCMSTDEITKWMNSIYVPIDVIDGSIHMGQERPDTITLFYDKPYVSKMFHEPLFKHPNLGMFIDKSVIAYSSISRAFLLYKRGRFEIGSHFGVSNIHDVEDDVYSVYPVDINVLMNNIDYIGDIKKGFVDKININRQLDTVDRMLSEETDNSLVPTFNREYERLKERSIRIHEECMDTVHNTYIKSKRLMITDQYRLDRVGGVIPFFKDVEINSVLCEKCDIKTITIPYNSVNVLTIRNCSRLTIINANRTKALEIYDCLNVKTINSEPRRDSLPSLKYLSLVNGDEYDSVVKPIIDTNMSLPISLEYLRVLGYTVILPFNMSLLTILNLCKTNIDVIPSTFVNLVSLSIDRADNLKTIPSTLTKLENLRIWYTPITEIPSSLVKLSSLLLHNCPEITVLPDTLVDLKSLTCNDCDKLNTIPNTYTTLQALSILDCPNIITIPKRYLLTTLLAYVAEGVYSIGKRESEYNQRDYVILDPLPQDYLNEVSEEGGVVSVRQSANYVEDEDIELVYTDEDEDEVKDDE